MVCGRGVGVGEQGAVDDVGESALEGAEGFGAGVAAGDAAVEVGLRRRGGSGPG